MNVNELQELQEWLERTSSKYYAEYGDTVTLADETPILCETDSEYLLRVANRRALWSILDGLEGLESGPRYVTVDVIAGSPAYWQGVAVLREIEEDYPIIDEALYSDLMFERIEQVTDDEIALHDNDNTEDCAICARYAPSIRRQMINAILYHSFAYDGEIWCPNEPKFEVIESELDYRDQPRKLFDLTPEERSIATTNLGVPLTELRYCVTARMLEAAK
jgi:hypothetical protein